VPWKDKDAQRRYNRDYNRAHRASLNAAQRAYSKRKRLWFRSRVFQLNNGRCHLCNIVLDFNLPWEIDHVVPRVHGGKDDITNYLPACIPCNRYKLTNHHDVDENDTSFNFGANVRLAAFEDDYRLLAEVQHGASLHGPKALDTYVETGTYWSSECETTPPLASEVSVD